jgi:hypothetical protein
MENVINLTTKPVEIIADLLTSFKKIGIAYGLYLQVPGDKEREPLKKYEQISMPFDVPGSGNIVPDLSGMLPDAAPKKKKAPVRQRPGKTIKNKYYVGLLPEILKRISPGAWYSVLSIAKSLYKDYGVRGQKKPKFHTAIYNVLFRNSELFDTDKTDPRNILYSLKKSENENA